MTTQIYCIAMQVKTQTHCVHSFHRKYTKNEMAWLNQIEKCLGYIFRKSLTEQSIEKFATNNIETHRLICPKTHLHVNAEWLNRWMSIFTKIILLHMLFYIWANHCNDWNRIDGHTMNFNMDTRYASFHSNRTVITIIINFSHHLVSTENSVHRDYMQIYNIRTLIWKRERNTDNKCIEMKMLLLLLLLPPPPSHACKIVASRYKMNEKKFVLDMHHNCVCVCVANLICLFVYPGFDAKDEWHEVYPWSAQVLSLLLLLLPLLCNLVCSFKILKVCTSDTRHGCYLPKTTTPTQNGCENNAIQKFRHKHLLNTTIACMAANGIMIWRNLRKIRYWNL